MNQAPRALCWAALWLATAATAAGQVVTMDATQHGITVIGSAQLNARPNLVEIDLRTSGLAELTDDALIKYRDSKQRTLEAFEALKMKNLTITERGIGLQPGNLQEMMQAMWNGMPANTAKKAKIEISSTLQLQLTDIEQVPEEEVLKTIGKLLDTAQDAGTGFGPSQAELTMAYRYGRQPTGTIVKFVLRDLDALREKVYEQAVADARSRAQRLAKLNGVRLGKVLSIQEQQVSGEEAGQRVYQPWEVASAEADSKKESRIEAATLSEIAFRVRLVVRFAIEDAEPATAQK